MKNLIIIIILLTLISCEKDEYDYTIPDPVYPTCTVFIEQVDIKTNDSVYHSLKAIKYIEDIDGYPTPSSPIYLNGSNRIDFQIKAESITLKLYPFNCNDQITYVKVKVFIDRVFWMDIEGSGNYLTLFD